MNTKRIGAALAAVSLGLIVMMAPSAAFATLHPGPPSGSDNCEPWISSLSVSGTTLHWTDTVTSCSGSGSYQIENDVTDTSHSSLGDEIDDVCQDIQVGCDVTGHYSISGHTGDKWCVFPVIEQTINNGVGPLRHGDKECIAG